MTMLPSCVSRDRKSTRLNSSHSQISYAVFCLKKKAPWASAETASSRDHRLRKLDERMPRRVDLIPAHVVDADLVIHSVREAHLDDTVDEGPTEVHRHRFVDSLLDRIQDEAEVRLRARRDDLEELGDRLWRVVQEQRRYCVKVNADGRPDLLARLAHRHPDSFEIAEA